MTVFNQIKMGAGGYICRIILHADGTKLIKTDSYGGYTWDASLGAGGEWRQLVTHAGISPALDFTDFYGIDSTRSEAMQGLYEVALAPTLSSRFYMMYRGYIYRSDNSGVNWTLQSGFAQVNPHSPNARHRFEGPYMAVDPNNEDVVYVGTMDDGVFLTTNGGTTWASVASVPTAGNYTDGSGTHYPGHKIIFDKYSGFTGTGSSKRTNRVYISSHGNGMYTGASGGSLSLMSGSPTEYRRVDVSPSGVLWAVVGKVGGVGTVSSFVPSTWPSGTWASKYSISTIQAIACNPSDATNVVIVKENSEPLETMNSGTAWSDETWASQLPATWLNPDIAWQTSANVGYVAAGDLAYDPNVSRRIWLAEGVGVWYMDLPAQPWYYHMPLTWNGQGRGIEQLIGWTAVCPDVAGAKPMLTCQDRGIFQVIDPTVYPSTYGPDQQFTACWSLDWATSNPAVLTALCNFSISPYESSAYSTDGGTNWTKWGSHPDNNTGGCIAAATASNWLMNSGNTGSGGHLYYTNNSGTTWNALASYFNTNFGAPSLTGWFGDPYQERQNLCADRSRPNTYYAYNGEGLYRTRDACATWTRVRSAISAANSAYCTIKAVPGVADYLFYTDGYQFAATPSTNDFYYSTDAGANWTVISGFKEVHAFGFGKAASGHTFPAIYAWGWYSGVLGFYRCIDWDGSKTWQMIDQAYAAGFFYGIKSIDADKNTYGKVYAAAQNGYVYYDEGAVAPVTTKARNLRLRLHS